MSWTSEVEIVWAGAERKFRLNLDQLFALETKFDVGPFELYQRLADGRARTAQIGDIIRLGLEGAGMKSPEIHSLMERWGPGKRPLLELLPVAKAILLSALVDKDAAPGEGDAAGGDPATSES